MTTARGARDPLRLGIVGCGSVTRYRHLPTLRRVPEIQVVALADVDPVALADVADRIGVSRRHTSARSLAEDPQVEAVAVCVPVTAHSEVALAAIEAGKDVFVEKPLARHLEEANHLLERAAGSPSRMLMGFNLRWHRHLQAARRLVGAGALGRVHALRTVFSDSVRSQPNLPEWRSRRDLGGGVLFDKLAHHFDLWRFLLDDEVEEVFALAGADRGDGDTVNIIGRMRGGVLVTALGLDDAVMAHEVTLYGELGGVHVDCYRFDGLVRSSRNDRPGAPRTRFLHLASAIKASRASLAAIWRGGDFNASYDGEWRHFAEVIRRGVPPLCGLADGRAALQIALAADRSMSLGEPVRIPPDTVRTSAR